MTSWLLLAERRIAWRRGSHGAQLGSVASCVRTPSPAPVPVTYARRLGLFSGTMVVVGGIIGSGIFLNPAIVAQRTGTPGLTLGTRCPVGVVVARQLRPGKTEFCSAASS